ncbi:hypothetical protein JTB14_001309 [Gonioctena quinquepunctata]|nr:hypothetical protein JTB14_001309 [Gonioctena quinquepunctata]
MNRRENESIWQLQFGRTRKELKVPAEQVFNSGRPHRWKIVESTRDRSAQKQAVLGEAKLKATPKQDRTANAYRKSKCFSYQSVVDVHRPTVTEESSITEVYSLTKVPSLSEVSFTEGSSVSKESSVVTEGSSVSELSKEVAELIEVGLLIPETSMATVCTSLRLLYLPESSTLRKTVSGLCVEDISFEMALLDVLAMLIHQDG